MNKVGILISTSILKLRVEKIFSQNTSLSVEHINPQRVTVNRLSSIFKEVNLLIIDLDHHELNVIERILEIRQVKELDKMAIVLLVNDTAVATVIKLASLKRLKIVLKPFTDDVFMDEIAKYLNGTEEFIVESQEVTGESDQPMDIKPSEPFLRWDSDFKLHIEDIDNEHKLIIDNFAKLYELMKDGQGHEYYGELLEFLKNYVNFHFEKEEAFQKEIGYDRITEHHELHEAFKKSIFEIFEEHKGKTVSNIDLIKINLFVKEWLTHHILIEDRKYGEYYTLKQGRE